MSVLMCHSGPSCALLSVSSEVCMPNNQVAQNYKANESVSWSISICHHSVMRFPTASVWDKPGDATRPNQVQVFKVCLFFTLSSFSSNLFADLTQLNTASLLHTTVVHLLCYNCAHYHLRFVIDVCKQSNSTLKRMQQQHAGLTGTLLASILCSNDLACCAAVIWHAVQ